MSADIWEDLVDRYLVQHCGYVTRRNHCIDQDQWKAQIDILAFDFSNSICWLVEVSTGNGNAIIEKAKNFEQYKERLRQWVFEHKIQPVIGTWTFSMMSFVRSDRDSIVSGSVAEINAGTPAVGVGKNLEETVLILLGMNADEASRRLEANLGLPSETV